MDNHLLSAGCNPQITFTICRVLVVTSEIEFAICRAGIAISKLAFLFLEQVLPTGKAGDDLKS